MNNKVSATTNSENAFTYLMSRLQGGKALAMFLAFIFMLGAGVFANYPAILLGRIVDQVDEGLVTSFDGVIPVLLLVSLSILGREILIILRKFIVEKTATQLEKEEFVSIIRKFLSYDVSFVVKERIGALNVRIHRSVEGIVKLIKLLFMDFLPTIIVALVAIYISFTRNYIVSIIMIVIALLGAIITWWQISSQRGIRIKLFSEKENIGANITELLFGIEYVRASGEQKHEVQRTDEIAENLREVEFKHHKWMMSFDGVKQIIEGVGYVAVIAYSAWLASNGFISKGDVFTLVALFGAVAIPLRELHRIIDEGFEATIKVQQLAELHNRPIDKGLLGQVDPNVIKKANNIIDIQNLSVEFFDNKGSKITALKGVNAQIKVGEMIGLAGTSGSGKSTFVKVILGLISNYKGHVKVFDVEVKDVSKDKLADLLAYVPQAPFLLKDSVRENVKYGVTNENIDDKSIWSALTKAQISDRVKALGGLDGEIAERGLNLSTGEKQRIVLTRVFLKNAELVILDEATAALDVANEKLVQQAIEIVTKGKTTLVIAHRLSTLRTTDRIFVFDKGEIVQVGGYEELSSKPGLFSELVKIDEQKTDLK